VPFLLKRGGNKAVLECERWQVGAAVLVAADTAIKFSFTITHRVFQPKVMERTDRRLMRVLSAS